MKRRELRRAKKLNANRVARDAYRDSLLFGRPNWVKLDWADWAGGGVGGSGWYLIND
jgi:hypothetical protein